MGQLSNPHKDHSRGAFFGLVNTDNGLPAIHIDLKDSMHPSLEKSSQRIKLRNLLESSSGTCVEQQWPKKGSKV